MSVNGVFLAGSLVVLYISSSEQSQTSWALRAFLCFMALATAGRLFQLHYERKYPSIVYTEWGSIIERPVSTVAGHVSAFLDRNLLLLSLIASIFMALILNKEASADALKHSKVLYTAAMFWIGLHFMYVVAATLFVPSLIVCFPCVVIGLRWLFHINPLPSTTAPGNTQRNAPATEEALERIWKVHYQPEASYTAGNLHLPALSKEDTKCSICLGWYEQGDELRVLPCLHHFHRECADHWLKITATCPLCVRSAIPGGDGDLNV